MAALQIHVIGGELTHVADNIQMQRCLQGQLKSSAEAALILQQARDLQGIPKTEQELKTERCKVWCQLFWSSFILSFLFNLIDTGSDLLIGYRYYNEMSGTTRTDHATDQCDEQYQLQPSNSSQLNQNCDQSAGPINLSCFPIALSPEQGYNYVM